MRSDSEVKNAIERYADTVKRISLMYVRNYHDVEDIFQTVFMKYALRVVLFQNPEHEKAWLIRVCINCCKDHVKSHWKKQVDLKGNGPDELSALPHEHSDVLQAIGSLAPKYRDVVYLHYYEGYKASEIAKITGTRENTVYSLMSRAREQLKQKLGGEQFG